MRRAIKTIGWVIVGFVILSSVVGVWSTAKGWGVTKERQLVQAAESTGTTLGQLNAAIYEMRKRVGEQKFVCRDDPAALRGISQLERMGDAEAVEAVCKKLWAIPDEEKRIRATVSFFGAEMPWDCEGTIAKGLDKQNGSIASEAAGSVTVFFLAWFFIGGIGAVIGQWRGDAHMGFIAGMLLGPIGWLATALSDFRRKCPACKAAIAGDATICMHCRTPFIVATAVDARRDRAAELLAAKQAQRAERRETAPLRKANEAAFDKMLDDIQGEVRSPAPPLPAKKLR